MKLKIFISLLFFGCVLNAIAKDIIVIENKNIPLNEREAILILPGFGSMYHNSKYQVIAFQKKGYDLFIPDYIGKKSIAQCVTNLDRFCKKQNLSQYKKIHVFAYIIGSWTINSWINQNLNNNIASVVYDRSPIQERAPKVLVTKYPLASRIVFGKLIRELSETPYPPVKKNNVNVAILIENKATKLMWKNKKEMEAMGPLFWDVKSLNQEYNDYAYIWLNHDDLYEQFDYLGPEILSFFKEGKFSKDAIRVPYSKDPFDSFYKK